MSARISSFAEFWPFYISQHRNPLCRIVHFIGTSGFLGFVALALSQRPVHVGLALAALLLIGWLSFRVEATRNAAPALLAMIVLLVVANPILLGGVVFAYAWAWVGHFRIEHNRPATFTYPLWSLAGDFRMWSLMLQGKLWSGDGSEIAPVERPAT